MHPGKRTVVTAHTPVSSHTAAVPPPLVRRTSSFTAKDAVETFSSMPESKAHDQKGIPDIDMKELMSGLLGGPPPPSDADNAGVTALSDPTPPSSLPTLSHPPAPLPALSFSPAGRPAPRRDTASPMLPTGSPAPAAPLQLLPVAAAVIDSADRAASRAADRAANHAADRVADCAFERTADRATECTPCRETSTLCADVDAEQMDSQSAACWGANLKGSPATCTPGFVSGKAHFKNKFCHACREGLAIPAARVRALTPEMRSLYTNSLRAGFWKLACPSIGGGEVRIANNTITCDGPWLVIYKGLPPDLPFCPMPLEWLSDDGIVPLSVAKGTLVPTYEMQQHAKGGKSAFAQQPGSAPKRQRRANQPYSAASLALASGMAVPPLLARSHSAQSQPGSFGSVDTASPVAVQSSSACVVTPHGEASAAIPHVLPSPRSSTLVQSVAVATPAAMTRSTPVGMVAAAVVPTAQTTRTHTPVSATFPVSAAAAVAAAATAATAATATTATTAAAAAVSAVSALPVGSTVAPRASGCAGGTYSGSCGNGGSQGSGGSVGANPLQLLSRAATVPVAQVATSCVGASIANAPSAVAACAPTPTAATLLHRKTHCGKIAHELTTAPGHSDSPGAVRAGLAFPASLGVLVPGESAHAPTGALTMEQPLSVNPSLPPSGAQRPIPSAATIGVTTPRAASPCPSTDTTARVPSPPSACTTSRAASGLASVNLSASSATLSLASQLGADLATAHERTISLLETVLTRGETSPAAVLSTVQWQSLQLQLDLTRAALEASRALPLPAAAASAHVAAAVEATTAAAAMAVASTTATTRQAHAPSASTRVVAEREQAPGSPALVAEGGDTGYGRGGASSDVGGRGAESELAEAGAGGEEVAGATAGAGVDSSGDDEHDSELMATAAPVFGLAELSEAAGLQWSEKSILTETSEGV
mmetsp:Transcript_52157/g.135257  ORF Transcript_52157/g.135257 Transcript_52157/m.135257 type:complete len:939 (+) Transcript_52157:82-2898(+)